MCEILLCSGYQSVIVKNSAHRKYPFRTGIITSRLIKEELSMSFDEGLPVPGASGA